PLTAFRARHTTASQAVGYDKSLMFFHMLRRRLGDHNFIKGLQIFFRDNRFKTAGYADLKLAFEKAAGVSIDTFFQHWTERNGAPRLAVGNLTVKQLGDGFQISGTLQQSQSSAPFPLKIPMLTRMKDGSVSQTTLSSQARETPFTIKVEQEPQQLQIDPWFDLFRQLDPAETPATLSRLFGSERILIVLPSNANKRMLQAYRGLAQQWSDGYDEADIRLDSELERLPRDHPVWLLGRENQFHSELVTRLSGMPISLETGSIKLAEAKYNTDDHSFVLSERNLQSGQTMAWVVGNSDAAITRLARKLPHYGKYSYLVFKGDKAQIALKGEWPITRSPLQFNFTKDGTVFEMREPGPLISMPD
ncbi:MAG: M1 family aminopeptidase, partial [Candidatus Thiodiazotropha endolucinida]